MRNKKISHMIRHGIVYLVVILGAITFLIPLAWMFVTSLKIPAQIHVYPPEWIPNPVAWENYLQILTFFPFFRYLLNTLYITSLNVIGVLVSCSLVAYGITHIQWPGRNVIFTLVISVLIVPYVVTLIPLYLMYHRLGWIGSYKPLWVASFFGVWTFHTFLLRQFFLAIPQELSNAAKIDGCSEFRIYWNIVLPLARPALFAVALFEFLWTWNDFLMPLVYLTNQKMYTLSLGLAFFQGTHDTAVNLLMAASSLVTIPVLILFFFAQRSFIEGITLTGLKG